MWWGVAAALLANALYSAGFVLEKRALAALPPVSVRRPLLLIRHLLRSPQWCWGALALGAGFAAQLVVYRTLPVAAAQAVLVSGLVLLLLVSPVLLGERVSGRELRATGGILLALLLVVLSLREDGTEPGTTAPASLILLICVPSLAAGLWTFGSAERRTRRRHRPPTEGVGFAAGIGLIYGVSSLAIKGISGLLPELAAGPAAAPARLLTTPYPYLLLCTGACGLVLSQAALQRCRATLIVPVCTTVSSVFTALLGTLAFRESLPAQPLALTCRLGGAALAVLVLLSLATQERRPADASPTRQEPTAREPLRRPVPEP
ncbi:hypothetical protein RM780_15135 [Streptomyces sp. DSM 44917]|uniref:EamA domain-containing protein n=1 Tax=Streptomyces boetiae TaxID=3075541 RepID=A0ABU2L9N8_9ACTN|nr:hypothetical protein [Streptomyces sp. DSM 44917]MDT0308286.1 hypothetical protein [Streptomyces sp. DSM 44917]